MDILKLNQFPNVAANAPATLVTDELDGMSVSALIFELGGGAFTKAMISKLNVSIDGKDLVPDITGTRLQLQNTYEGLSNNANYLVVHFGDPLARTIRGQHLGDLDLSIYRSPLTIEVDIGGATTPTLQVYALVGAPKLAMGLQYGDVDASIIRALTRTVITPNAAVSKKSYGIGLGSEAGARLRRIYLHHANLTSVEFKKSSVVLHDNISIALNGLIQSEFARSSQAALYVLDRIVDGNQGEAETTLKNDGSPWNFQVNLTTSAADVIFAYSDIHTALPLL